MKLTYIEKLSHSKALNKYTGCLVIIVCGTNGACSARQGRGLAVLALDEVRCRGSTGRWILP